MGSPLPLQMPESPKQTLGGQIISNIRYLINDRVKLSFVLLTLYVYISPVSRFGGGYAGFGDLAIHRYTFWLIVQLRTINSLLLYGYSGTDIEFELGFYYNDGVHLDGTGA